MQVFAYVSATWSPARAVTTLAVFVLCVNFHCCISNQPIHLFLQVTSDWFMQKGTGCTDGHTGTSAAAPLAAGMVALMLQVRPCLSWRDVQHIITYTATKVGLMKYLVASISIQAFVDT